MRLRIRTLLLSPLIFLSACAVGPDYTTPETPVESSFSGAALVATAVDNVDPGWWRSFNDPTLVELVQEAVASNKDVHLALARVEQSRANRRESTFDLFPTITGRAGYTEFKGAFPGLTPGQGTGGGPGIPIGGEAQTFYTGSFNALWELDFFGRVRRNVESAEAAEEASQADLADALRIVIADVARSYFELRGLQEQLRVARENASNQQKTVELTDTLFEGGRVTALDTSRARSLWKATEAAIPPVEHAIRAAIYRIGVLLGRQPHAFIDKLSVPVTIPQFQGPLRIGNPADLLKRRPDVRSAERRLHAATAQVGVAMGDYFPRVTFNGSLGYQAQSFRDWGNEGTDTYSFGPSLTWAAFDLGRVHARVRAADARLDQALSTYERSVLLALEETEVALSLYSSELQRRQLLVESTKQSSTAADLARLQYNDGIVDFLSVLDAERALLLQKDQLAQSDTRVATALVSIYRALGGGWEEYRVNDGMLERREIDQATAAPSVTMVAVTGR